MDRRSLAGCAARPLLGQSLLLAILLDRGEALAVDFWPASSLLTRCLVPAFGGADRG